MHAMVASMIALEKHTRSAKGLGEEHRLPLSFSSFFDNLIIILIQSIIHAINSQIKKKTSRFIRKLQSIHTMAPIAPLALGIPLVNTYSTDSSAPKS